MRWSLFLAILLAAPPEARAAGPEVSAVVSANTRFAFDLYRQVSAREKKAPQNIALSPYGISTALALALAGAKGETAAEMARALHLSSPGPRLHRAFQRVLRATAGASKRKGIQLSVANALWGQKGLPFLEGFRSLARARYRAGLRQVDFIKDAEGARATINRWAERKTKKRIKNLIPEGALDAACRLVLINAIHFKGAWAEAFDKRVTGPLPFQRPVAGLVRVPMMRMKTELRYHQGEGFQALELPYKGGRVSMVVLLPAARGGLPRLEGRLGARFLAETLEAMRATRVSVYLPRFKTTSEVMLGRELEGLGMRLAFSEDADFSGMTGAERLQISKVIHRAFVEVNEKGTEAAAATWGVSELSATLVPDPVFRADRPFFFLIREKKTGSVLFMGRVIDPTR